MGRLEDILLGLCRCETLPSGYVYPASVKQLEPGLRASLVENRRIINTALTPKRASGEGGLPFHFDYMDSDFSNAIAFQYDGYAFIIATVPMVQLLMRTSEILSTSPSIVSLLGPSPIELPRQEGLKMALFAIQLGFLALHERAHHILGHVELVRAHV